MLRAARLVCVAALGLAALGMARVPAAAQSAPTSPVGPVAAGSPDRAALAASLMALVETGNTEAAYHLGMMRMLGIGGDKDPLAAVNLFRLAEKGGEPLAAYALGDAYAKGVAGVIEADLAEAQRLKLIAAEAGYAQAQHDVARRYFETGDIDAALEWLTRAAGQGQADALRALASLHNSDAIPRDGARTFAYFTLYLRRLAAPTQKQQAFLEDFVTRLSPEDRTRGEAIVANFAITASPVTLRAVQGLRAAAALVASKTPAP